VEIIARLESKNGYIADFPICVKEGKTYTGVFFTVAGDMTTEEHKTISRKFMSKGPLKKTASQIILELSKLFNIDELKFNYRYPDFCDHDCEFVWEKKING